MNNTLTTGGITASMINAANELCNEYDVSVFCYKPDGFLKSRLDKRVHILESSWRLQAICSTIGDAKKMGFKYFVVKVFSRIWSVLFNNRLPIFCAISHQKHLGHFDLACSYTHEATKHIEYTGLIRVLIRKVDSPVKLSWVHCDSNKVKRSTFNNRYYNKINGVVGVSESVSNAFRINNPKVTVPVMTCFNMIDYSEVATLSKQEQTVPFNENGIICFSACRLSPVKAIERTIYAIADIMERNNVYWYIAGDGPLRESIADAIEKNGLSKRVFLIGKQSNPFSFMRNADLYLSVSYEEAAPLVFLESKALHLPIFSTNTLSAKEMLDDRIDYIVENNDKEIALCFEAATSDLAELKRRKEMLSSYVANNSRSISFYKKMLGDCND